MIVPNVVLITLLTSSTWAIPVARDAVLPRADSADLTTTTTGASLDAEAAAPVLHARWNNNNNNRANKALNTLKTDKTNYNKAVNNLNKEKGEYGNAVKHLNKEKGEYKAAVSTYKNDKAKVGQDRYAVGKDRFRLGKDTSRYQKDGQVLGNAKKFAGYEKAAYDNALKGEKYATTSKDRTAAKNAAHADYAAYTGAAKSEAVANNAYKAAGAAVSRDKGVLVNDERKLRGDRDATKVAFGNVQKEKSDVHNAQRVVNKERMDVNQAQGTVNRDRTAVKADQRAYDRARTSNW